MRLMNGAHFPPNVANLHAAPPNVSPHLPGAEGLAFDITKSFWGQNRFHRRVSVSVLIALLN